MRSTSQLTVPELEGVARLEAACTAADGGRLKLEWPTLRQRFDYRGESASELAHDFVWVDEDIIGFLGLYQWRSGEIEISGMVAPARRRQGIAGLLYEAACAEIGRRGGGTVLLVVDRSYGPGAEFAKVFGGTLDHSEHRMVQVREPAPVPAAAAAAISVREAGPADARFLSACLAAAFDEPVGTVDESDADAVRRHVAGTLVISASDVPVGVMRVERNGKDAGIYGFAVAPEFQGRGYGRAALSSVTSGLRADGVTVALEVLSTNDHALNLYLSCGFEARGTDDYYEMPMTSGGSDSPDQGD